MCLPEPTYDGEHIGKPYSLATTLEKNVRGRGQGYRVHQELLRHPKPSRFDVMRLRWSGTLLPPASRIYSLTEEDCPALEKKIHAYPLLLQTASR